MKPKSGVNCIEKTAPRTSVNERLGRGRTNSPEFTPKSDNNNNNNNRTEKGKGHNYTMVPKDCVCNRPAKTIRCKACDFRFKGRIRVDCPKCGPNSAYLMDFSTCPNKHCRKESLFLVET